MIIDCGVIVSNSDSDMPSAAGDSVNGGMPHRAIAALGLVTIAAYGCGYYAFGVLLGPILDDTGWSEAVVAAAFSASILIGALGAGQAGRLIDQHGARPLMLLGGLVGCAFYAAAAVATNQFLFLSTYALGGGLLSASGFYHVTQATAAKTATGNPARAIMLLTVYGAFAGPIYLPATGFLVEATDWRTTMILLASVSATGFMVAALVIGKTTKVAKPAGPAPSVGQALRDPVARTLLVSSFIGSVGLGTLMVYQVPLMVAAGLSLSTAASVAGVRGFAQFAGRVGIIPVQPHIGARQILTGAYALAGMSAVILAFSGNVPVALVFVATAGIAIGIWSPMTAIYAHELVPLSRVATLMGTERMLSGFGNATGPLVAGIVAEATGGRGPTIIIACVGAMAAALILALPTRRQDHETASSKTTEHTR